MAKILPFTDDRNHTDLKSYWMFDGVAFSKRQRVAVITFLGFKDKATANPERKARPIGEKKFTARDEEFDALVAAHLAGGVNIIQQCYAVASAHDANFAAGVNDL